MRCHGDPIPANPRQNSNGDAIIQSACEETSVHASASAYSSQPSRLYVVSEALNLVYLTQGLNIQTDSGRNTSRCCSFWKIFVEKKDLLTSMEVEKPTINDQNHSWKVAEDNPSEV